MAIKNTSLGGTDFGDERVQWFDLNDTFDEIASIVDAGNDGTG